MTLGLSFDPTEVWIKTPDGHALHPVSYVGPGEPGVFGEHAWGCGHQQGALRPTLGDLPRRTEARAWPLPLGSTCFVVAFDARVMPPQGVIVNVQGVRRGGRPVPIPGNHFFRRAAGDRLVNVRPAALP